MPEYMGENHFAFLYAKISDRLVLKDLDQRVVELASKLVEDSESETEKAQRLLHLQILYEACSPDEYEHVKKNGYLSKTVLTSDVLASNKGWRQLPCGAEYLIGWHTKVTTQFGHFIKSGEQYLISHMRPENSLGVGFHLNIWNNLQSDVTKMDCEIMLGKIIDVINKYTMVETVRTGSS